MRLLNKANQDGYEIIQKITEESIRSNRFNFQNILLKLIPYVMEYSEQRVGKV